MYLEVLKLHLSIEMIRLSGTVMKFNSPLKHLVALPIALLLQGCGEDHIEKCVQAGLKSWDINQAWYADREKKSKEEEVRSQPTYKQENVGNISDFFNAPATKAAVQMPPDSRAAAEFRVRGYCLSQSKPSR